MDTLIECAGLSLLDAGRYSFVMFHHKQLEALHVWSQARLAVCSGKQQ